MTKPRPVSAAVARRFMVLRHLLAPPRQLPGEPESVMRVVERLGSLQFDPLEIAGRNHDLVLLARIDAYRRSWTDRLLYEDRRLFEAYNKGLSLLPTAELPWYRVAWDRARRNHEGGAFDEHAPLVDELLELVRSRGELSPTDLEPRAAIDWYWRPTNQVRAILEALAEAGILGLARREGNRRVYDLAERLFPAALLAERRPEREQRQHKLLSRYRAHGMLARSGGSAELWLGVGPAKADPAAPDGLTRAALLHDLLDDGTLVPVAIEGFRADRLVLATELPLLEQAAHEVDLGLPPSGFGAGVAFLAPLDPFMWDRDFVRRLFTFDYVWEVYVPETKRRWGYYVLPILYGDRLVGRIEPRIARRSGELKVVGLWWEEGFDPLADESFLPALGAALEAHARFGAAERIVLPATGRHRDLARRMRDHLPPAPRPRSHSKKPLRAARLNVAGDAAASTAASGGATAASGGGTAAGRAARP